MKCPMLEEALAKDIDSINDIKDMATVKLCFTEEQKANHLQISINAESSEDSIRPDDVRPTSYSYMGFGLNNISELRSESTNLQNHLNPPSDSEEEYAGVINECIIKVADQINTSGQVIVEVKSLAGIIKNNLVNIKSPKKSWRSIIKHDKTLSEKVMRVMSDLQIFEISKDSKEIKMNEDRLGEFKQKDFDKKEFKKKVKIRIHRLFQI